MRQKVFLGKARGRTILAFALFAALLLGGVKQAEASILFSYSDGSNTAYGMLSADDLGGGQFLATGGSVTVTGAAAGTYTLVPGGPTPFYMPPSGSGFIVDNVITPSGNPTLDVNGIGFVNGLTYLNIWGNGADNYSFYTYTEASSYGVQYNGGATVSAAVTPEPATLTIWGVGALVCTLAVARRRKQVA